MALSSSYLLITTILVILIFVSFSNAQPTSSSRPQGVVLPVTKDASTLQYVTYMKQRTPLVSESLVINLSGEFQWVDCENGYVSSSNRTLSCSGKECPWISGASCGRPPRPPGFQPCRGFVYLSNQGVFASDVVSVPSFINGSKTGPDVAVKEFVFGCGSTSLLQGLAKGVKGIAGFGPFQVSVPSQFSLALRIPRVFSMCLPSSTEASSKGAIFIGGGPYKMRPGIDLSTSLSYTPFYTSLVGPNFTSGYYIQVKSINIGGKKVPVVSDNTTFDSLGFMKLTSISTLIPYTVLPSSVYKPFISIFIEKAKAMNIASVAPVAPFGACFNSRNIFITHTGGLVPEINFVLHAEKVAWRISGSNSMVKVSDTVSCLGFVDGGEFANLVIGGHQLEDNLLEFNLAKKRLGFTSTLPRQTACSLFMLGEKFLAAT
ncbi:hypothetical protein C5167_021044 [Papaver somniferum]|uniref:Peptidase A1 domain-containing protein n=1 Tax=Papaver somniferum TaxID=3469 RepID=A0A4Y7IXV0_PAPSO|nr:basic 7S globulin-like [Papaver somniferum]RZC52620.1 hypothetical protein C5167_021044 [Papaver somniferum]